MLLENIALGNVFFSKKNNTKITVEAITTNGRVVCVWIDPDGHSHRELLNPKDLEEA